MAILSAGNIDSIYEVPIQYITIMVFIVILCHIIVIWMLDKINMYGYAKRQIQEYYISNGMSMPDNINGSSLGKSLMSSQFY